MARRRRPKPFGMGTVRVRIVRGPRDEDGRYYWRAERNRNNKRTTVWTGWGSRREAEQAVALVLTRPEVDPAVMEVVTLGHLLGRWLAP